MEPARSDHVCTHLIVVGDDPITRSMIANYFVKEGFHIEAASCGAECRNLMRQQRPDLVFVDIHLPDGNGLDLAQEIRAESAAGIKAAPRQRGAVLRPSVPGHGWQRRQDQ